MIFSYLIEDVIMPTNLIQISPQIHDHIININLPISLHIEIIVHLQSSNIYRHIHIDILHPHNMFYDTST